MKISTAIEHWPFLRPFRITGHVFDGMDVLLATIEHDGLSGRAESAGVYYKGETAATLDEQIRRFAENRSVISRQELARTLGAGGARNALDCALWDLEAKQARQPVWKLAGLGAARPLLTTLTLGADDPGRMAEMATRLIGARALKLKLLGDGEDGERVRAVRAERPDVWMGVDANQGFTPDTYHALLPALLDARVELVEQPFRVERDCDLDHLGSPIPIAADESVQDRADLEQLIGRVDVINIKLDKCGGLTEALALAFAARRAGMKVMVGNMVGTSLSVAPSFVLGQLCDFVDLDGPIFLARDRSPAVTYTDGFVDCPDELWGSASTALPLELAR